MTTTTPPRGIRNCNPGNIRISSEKFQGEVIPSRDKAFKQFRSMAYGYRAMFAILRTYHNKHRLDTIAGIITRWAPPGDNNDTPAYIAAVARHAAVAPDAPIPLSDQPTRCRVVEAMSLVENGIPANPGEVRAGWDLL